MEQIIGDYKQFIVIERDLLENLQKKAEEKIEDGIWEKSNDLYVEGKITLDIIKFIKENNIYNKDFKIKR
jgi:hypothetical protein